MRLFISLVTSMLITALLLGTAASCGGRVHKAPMKGATPLEQNAFTLQDALTELDALEKPEGVDEKVWVELKGALKSALTTNNQQLTTRIVSKPPTGATNKVYDLTATRETNGDFTLSWHYRNLGDYNQDGVVGVADITPLAMHYNETYDAVTGPDCIQAVVDGSGNGKVGVEDVTQLAQYFGNEFALYALQGGDQQQGPFTQAFTAELPADGRSDARLSFTHNLFDIPDYTYWRVVPLDGNNNPGEASNVVALNVEAPVRVLGVTPLQGLAGADVTFTAFVAGTGPFTYEWDFGTGATPNISTAAQPTVTLSTTEGDYSAQVKVTGANGNATRHFTLTVMTSPPGEAPVINSVGPFSGLSGEQLNFNANVSGDEPLTYSWEFDGGASPPVSAEANPTAILSRGGTLPAPNKDYPCRLTITNEFGASSVAFTITVTAQWHVEDLPPVPDDNDYKWSNPVLDKDGFLRGVYYYDPTPGSTGGEESRLLKYANKQWVYEKIKDGGLGKASLAFTIFGEPALGLGLETTQMSGELYYLQKLGDSWLDGELIFSGGAFAPECKLFFDKRDAPVLLYSYIESDTSFPNKAARKTSTGWTITSAYRGAAVLDAVGKLVIASGDKNEHVAMLYRETESGWNASVIVEASPQTSSGYSKSITIDSAGLIHAIAYGGADKGLLVARETGSGSFTLEPITEPSPKPTSYGWNPMILMLDDNTEIILFTSYRNDTGSDWICWKGSSGWEQEPSPLQVYTADRENQLMVSPSGNLMITSLHQIAVYW